MPHHRSIAASIALSCLASASACAEKYIQDPTEVEPRTPASLCRGAEPEEGEFCLPTQAVYDVLRSGRFEVVGVESAKSGVSKPAMLTLSTQHDGRPFVFRVKWKPAPESGDAINNSPRRELAAYELQKFFLDPSEYVVPPTVGYCFPARLYRGKIGYDTPQFDGTDCVFGTLSYWLENVTDEAVWDAERYESDPAYATAISNLNVFTYLADHADTREGNLLISTDDDRVRAFAVDNGITFGSLIENPIHHEWKKILVPDVPENTVQRLREIQPEELVALANVAQFEERDGVLVAVAADPLPAPRQDAVRWHPPILQLGLDNQEIDDVKDRLISLLDRVEKRELALRR